MPYLILATSLVLLLLNPLNAQEMSVDTTNLPYESIGEYPEDYQPGSVLARYLNGLGYRYHWATRNLREADLAYRPTPEASSTLETMEHIHGLSVSIRTAAANDVNERKPKQEMTAAELRATTLQNIHAASELLLGKTAEEMAELNLKYRQRDDQVAYLDFWLVINGQMSDALYHVGQIVSFRRTSGNPMHPGVSVFRGETKQ